ncbi:MAG: amino acid ABC transporter ATP-binding/permease protein [Catenibacillus sp.]
MKRRSGIQIMGKLIGLVAPLMHVMAGAVILGVVGYLCAIFLTIFAAQGILKILPPALAGNADFSGVLLGTLMTVMLICAVARGLFHYGEQACNHYIAFKLLAMIRHKVFTALRGLAPAKLEGRDKGNLIMVFFIGSINFWAGLFALTAYVIVGVGLPLWNSRRTKNIGMAYREEFGQLNSFVLDSLRGISETIRYGQGEQRKREMVEKTQQLSAKEKRLKEIAGTSRAVTDMVIMLSSFGMLFLMVALYQNNSGNFGEIFICTVAMMGSFGPVAALSSLSNNLNQTLASGERVLSILEEVGQTREITDGADIAFNGARCDDVTFGYDDEVILNHCSAAFEKGKITGIHGRSGSGKSTLLKLLMRFWDVDSGRVLLSERDVREINTTNLRDQESYVTQETYLFNDTIEANIAVAKPGASMEEIVEAAKKASLDEFIQSLPNGYQTKTGELGDLLSGGERQRIGMARAFLHDAPLMLLDEPTSNLDSLNEGIILKSLKESAKDRTVILVSHRRSTMNITDCIFEMDTARQS